MDASQLFQPGIAPNLLSNPPAERPEAPGAGDAMAGLSPFKEALDVDEITRNLVLDRPLKLYIPNRQDYPEYEFRIINSVPSEMGDAQNKGWKPVTDEKLTALFENLVSGKDEFGKAYRPILMGRPKAVGDIIRKRTRATLASVYAGMDPRKRELDGKYTENIQSGPGASKGSFSGDGWKIRV